MENDRFGSAIEQVLVRLKAATGEEPSSWEMESSPICVLDIESYDLLVARTDHVRYSVFFTRAIRAIKPIVTVNQLTQVIDGMRKSRRGSRYKNVRARVGKPELQWVVEMATAMRMKPARVMESVIFLYLRALDQVSADPSYQLPSSD